MKFLLLFLLLMTDIALACEEMTFPELQERLKREMAGEVTSAATGRVTSASASSASASASSASASSASASVSASALSASAPTSQLVFFASWCASCKKHLVAEELARSYFVAIFDEAPAAERAFVAFLGRDALKRCVFDKDGSIAAAYQVKSLPAVRPLSALKN